VSRLGSASARRSLAVLVDQGLSSASNFLLVILVARSLSTRDFGTFAIAFSCLALGLGLSRANIGVPLSIDLPGESDVRVVDEAVARSIAVGIATGAVLGLVVAGIALFLADGSGLRASLLVLACASPFLVAQDVARYVAIAQGVPRRAAVADGLWVLVGVAVLVGGELGGRQSASIAAGGWVLGGLIGLVALRPCLRRPVWRSTTHWFATDRRRRHLTVDALTSAVAPLLVVTLVATIVSPVAVGSLRGASTLMSPINVAIAAVSLGAVAEIRRRPWPHARRFMALLCLGLAGCAVLWGVGVLLLPDSVGQFLLGHTWSSARPVLPFSAAEFAALAIWNGAVALLRASERTRLSAALRVVYLVLGVSAAAAAALATGSAVGIQAALAATAVALAVISWLRAWPSAEQQQSHSPVASPLP
jgi:O-antigen/teichoic acid export membrane protein